ncbi:MAG: PEP-CTERM sorting domain-containing protein [Firmicutes bacterium]|nr:PEP-CTERM sorting domain-containing protein [Bacillota bacterium]
MKKLMAITVCLLLVMVLFLIGCGKRNSTSPQEINLNFDFSKGELGWIGDFVDLPDEEDMDHYDLKFGWVERPSELGPGKALMISGGNRSDDLFMYFRKQIGTAEGLKSNATYKIVLKATFGSNAPANAVGIGGPPGEAVYVKVGAAVTEPVPVKVSGDDWWRLSVDKDNQSGSGKDGVVVGDVSKPTSDDFETYELKTLENAGAPLEVTTDANGNLWLFFGTDSGFEGTTTLYYTGLDVSLIEK